MFLPAARSIRERCARLPARLDFDVHVDQRYGRRRDAGDAAGLTQGAGRTRISFSFISRDRPLTLP